MAKKNKNQKEKTRGPTPEVMHQAKLARKAGINAIRKKFF